MKKQTREKIALIVFVGLAVLALIVLIGYFSTGRSWTVAASVVDDIAGEMDSYTAIVYKGTVNSESNSEDQFEDELNGGLFNDNEDIFSGEKTLSIHDANSHFKSLLPDIFTHKQGNKNGENDTQVFVSDVRDAYEEKGSKVITLNLENSSSYYSPQVLFAGDKRIGVFAVDYYATNARISRITRYFKQNKVDSVICLTPRTNMLASYSGIDVVIVTTNSENIPTSGKIIKSTFVVRAPLNEQVGVVILSENGVPSAKVVTEL